MSFISNFLIKQNITSIVFFGFCVRILTLIFYGSPKFGDSQTYERIGREIFNGSLVATDHHMPGYGVWMFISNSISQNYYGVIITDILISSATIYLIYLLSKEIFNDQIISKISAVIFALYPMSIYFSISSLSESLYVFLLILGILLLYKDKLLMAIFILVLSIYVKSISDYLVPVLILSFAIIKKHSLKKTFLNLSCYFVIYSILLAPWWIHNLKKYNKFVRTDLGYGIHLYSGNNPMNKTGGGIGGLDVYHGEILDSVDHDPILSDKIFKDKAYKYIKENPKIFLKSVKTKFLRFWNPYIQDRPYPDGNDEISLIKNKTIYKIILLLSYGSILFLSLFFLANYEKKNFSRIFPLLILILLFTLAYSLTIVSIRYRFPIEFILIIFASYSLKRIMRI